MGVAREAEVGVEEGAVEDAGGTIRGERVVEDMRLEGVLRGGERLGEGTETGERLALQHWINGPRGIAGKQALRVSVHELRVGKEFGHLLGERLKVGKQQERMDVMCAEPARMFRSQVGQDDAPEIGDGGAEPDEGHIVEETHLGEFRRVDGIEPRLRFHECPEIVSDSLLIVAVEIDLAVQRCGVAVGRGFNPRDMVQLCLECAPEVVRQGFERLGIRRIDFEELLAELDVAALRGGREPVPSFEELGGGLEVALLLGHEAGIEVELLRTGDELRERHLAVICERELLDEADFRGLRRHGHHSCGNKECGCTFH